MLGKTISHYKILEKLGGGGMGVVYKAEDTKLDRFVALKFLPPHLSQAEEEKKRFIHEAKAASALDHPNICTIYDIKETEDQQLFIVMACYDGESLKDKIQRGPLPIEEAIEIAIQITEGLSKAHSKEIVHRDIKPANILITEDRQVKIVDFGLAKLAGRTMLTKEGTTLGTVSYMSPEQARGEEVDHRTDIFSLGVLLYETLAGRQPFEGDYEQAVIYSMLNEDPKPLQDVPEQLQNLVSRALEKDQEERIQSAQQLLQDLKKLRGERAVSSSESVDLKVLLWLFKKPQVAIPALIILLLLITVVFVPYQRRLKVQNAKALIPQIEKLAKAGKYVEAYDLAVQAEEHLKGDSTIVRLLPMISDMLTIKSEPEGASVFLQRFVADNQGDPPRNQYVGVTPIKALRVARNAQKVTLEKQGYVPVERIASSEFNRTLATVGVSSDIEIEVKLFKSDKIPENMVYVPGGDYKLVSSDAPTTAEVNLKDYYIDKYEVSNKQYKAFIDAGGYLNKEHWKHPFVKDGKELSWEEAMPQFKDRTGLPGPRSWSNQEYPEGKANRPVTDVTWYEAAAFAEFVGKRLPTVFQWEKAARNGIMTYRGLFMPWGLVSAKEKNKNRANFGGKDTAPVDSYAFGISPYGCYHMAGNVAEWCRNAMTGGYGTTGGSFADPEYMFYYYGPFPGVFSSRSIGFRCVQNSVETTTEQGAMYIDLEKRTPSYSPVDAATFNSFLSHYKYDKKPLNAQIVETVETDSWIREKIQFAGVGSDQIIAYLFLPKRAVQPYQCINLIPTLSVFYTRTSEGAERYLGPHIKSGRAVLAVVPWGAVERERESDYTWPAMNTVGYRELMIRDATEFSIGLDYLSTRDDIDITKVAYLGVSEGAQGWLVHAAVEERYRSVVLVGAGVFEFDQEKLPEVNPINLVSYIKPPKLLLHGKYDEDSRLETNFRPLYNLLSEPKKLVLVESGHIPSLEDRVPVINKWLDETLGPVKFQSTQE